MGFLQIWMAELEEVGAVGPTFMPERKYLQPTVGKRISQFGEEGTPTTTTKRSIDKVDSRIFGFQKEFFKRFKDHDIHQLNFVFNLVRPSVKTLFEGRSLQNP